MSSMIKSNISISVFGESHQETMGIVIDGLVPGITLDFDFINQELFRRRPQNQLSTSRIEADEYKVVSGYFNNKTTGSPLCILVNNNNINSSEYDPNLVRPSHVDYVINSKYNRCYDYRGSGHLSGRLTVLYTIAGAICKQILKNKNVTIASHIKQMHDIKDDNFDYNHLEQQISDLATQSFPVLNQKTKVKMEKLIGKVAKNNDSIGGIIETIIYPMMANVGEPLFDSLESQISRYIFSIPAVKGISFGLGFDYVHETGSSSNDAWQIENGRCFTLTNNNGGINGGISNGMPIVFSTMIKPTPSIGIKQKSINLETMENSFIQVNGRHDPAIVSRCAVIIESMTAIALLDLIVAQFGKEWML